LIEHALSLSPTHSLMHMGIRAHMHTFSVVADTKVVKLKN